MHHATCPVFIARKYFVRLFWVFLGGILILRLYPVKTSTLTSSPHPSRSYEESLRRIQALEDADSPDIIPNGRLIFLDQGRTAPHVIVFFHGFTNSPHQFQTLGEEFYKRGYNVLIPRVPHHGLRDRMGKELAFLTAEELKTTCEEAVDIAQGLGTHVTVAGLSMGGVMAGWAAQFRDDVDLAVLIAPSFGTFRVPAWFVKHTINFMALWPNRFIWWDRRLKTAAPGPESAYYGFSSKALGQIRRLGWVVQAQGQLSAPKAKSVLVITNAHDKAVNKKSIAIVQDNWKRYRPRAIRFYEFPEALKLNHDLIDPQQPGQRIQLIYPRILSLITGVE
ncbi:MAG TPA: alpha/beta fold hydrolase [Candidatus Omnitrophota bacterium]|nr:alpha/beta fold hydrolase [Candidatus Omnitrophota bacterium]HPB69145.1 alpha/beta fold hydrolase [Candidatus Omnitrophota bacterium]HQO59169.1 alpha/beta fold hydrolase [Candidatus Omnitrophota bacterium]